MTATIERLEALAVPVPVPRVAGRWFNVRFCPNLAGGELFNVGVAYVDKQREEIHTRLIENLDAFRTLFGETFEEELRFSLEVTRSAFAQKMLESPLRTIAFGEPRFAAGESEKAVVDRLFAATVSFAEARQLPAARRDPAGGNAAVRKAVFDVVRLKADLRADRIIAADPIYFVSDGSRKYALDIPIRGASCLGSVVSAAYRTKQPLENNLLRASLDLETAARIFQQDQLGFFIMRSGPDETEHLADPSLDEVIDTVGWKLHRQGIHVGVEDTPDRLAEDILNWSGI